MNSKTEIISQKKLFKNLNSFFCAYPVTSVPYLLGEELNPNARI